LQAFDEAYHRGGTHRCMGCGIEIGSRCECGTAYIPTGRAAAAAAAAGGAAPKPTAPRHPFDLNPSDEANAVATTLHEFLIEYEAKIESWLRDRALSV
jgi:hypothetical protein